MLVPKATDGATIVQIQSAGAIIVESDGAVLAEKILVTSRCAQWRAEASWVHHCCSLCKICAQGARAVQWRVIDQVRSAPGKSCKLADFYYLCCRTKCFLHNSLNHFLQLQREASRADLASQAVV